MWLRLASLWGCPVTEARRRVTRHEFAYWCAYWLIEPWGEIRADYRMARICQVIAACHSGRGRRPKLEDFLLFDDHAERKRPTANELKAKLWAAIGPQPRGQRVVAKER